MATVLLIDDDDLLRAAVRDLLVVAGHRVLEAGGGRAGLMLAEGADVVIVDVFMPDLDGIEVLARLQRVAPRLPVIVVTGDPRFTGVDVRSVARHLGARAVLLKPFGDGVVKAAVDAALAERASA